MYFQKASGEKIRILKGRTCSKTLPLLAFQIFEDQIAALSECQRNTFPVSRYLMLNETFYGIFSTEEELRQKEKGKFKPTSDRECLCYKNEETKREFWIYSFYIFPQTLFVQECLKRWGKEGDKFVVAYRKSQQVD